LRNAAALLYPEDSSARVIVDDAGLDARQIAFSSRAESNWHNILAEAIRCNCLAALLNIVCQAYPTNPSLQAAILNYQQFVEAGGQFDVPAQVSPGTTIYGDQTSVGNISQSMAVAIGTGATASVAMTEEVAYSVHGLKNPYIGLSAFNYDDRAKYAGRDAKIREALEKLTEPGKEQTVLFVTGASGSGKSSFVQAGLLPQLREYYEKRHKQVRIATFRPKDQPFANLDDALSQLAPQANRDLATFTPPNQINILVIDQFEEVFTQAHLKVDAEFFQWLQKVPAFPQGRTYIIATIRSDYLNELFNLTKLYDLNRSGVDLRVMTVDELREAIQRPLQVCFPNGERRFEPALVQKLAQEASERSTLLPLLQVALENLWKQGVLRLAAYRKLGDAIQERAEEVYTSRSDPNANNQIKRSEHEQQELMDILLDLIHVAIDNTDRREVRQPRLRQELEKGSLQRRQLIEELVNARLLAIDTEMRNGNVVEIIDIIHESLIDNWNRLKYAIEEKREQLQRRTRFKLWLGEWLRNG